MKTLETETSILALQAGIGLRIKHWREKELHIQQQELAKRLGVVNNAVSLWERNGKISRESLMALHETYHVCTDWLLGGSKTWQAELWERVNKRPSHEREHLKGALFDVVKRWEAGHPSTENSNGSVPKSA